MAVTITKNLSDVHDASTTSGWTSDGNWGSLATDTSIFREGGTSLRGQVSASAGHVYYTLGTSVDLTAAANRRVYAWLLPPGSFDTIANGGLRIVLGDSVSGNRRGYYVGGNDTTLFTAGAWYCVTLDVNNLPASYAQLAGTGAPTFTAIDQIGVGINNPSKAVGNSPNSWFDIVRYGTGITVYAGTSGAPGTFADIAADDASTAAGKAYGIVRKIQAGVYGVQGDITWGDSAGSNTFYFKDSSAVVVAEDHVLGTGTPTDIQFKVVGNGTAATQHFELGLAVGTGDTQSGRNGVTFLNANITSLPVIFDASNINVQEVFLYGCTFTGVKKASTLNPIFSSDATNGPNHVLSGVTFDRCTQVDIGRVPARNCNFSGYTPDTNGALWWQTNIDIKNSKFLANTDSTNSPAAIEQDTAGSFTYDNLTFSGNDYDINNSSTGAVVINASNGANPSTYKDTGGGSTTINNTKTLQVKVNDQDGNAVQGIQVYIQKDASETGDYGHPTNPFTSSTGNSQGNTSFVVTETPPSDLPAAGWIVVQDVSTAKEQQYRYASKSGSTFTFNSTVTGTDNGTGNSTTLNETGIGSKNIVEGDTVRNTTAGEWATVLTVSANSVTTTTLSGGASWASASYSVHTLAITYVSGTDTATVPLMNEETNASGIATESYNYGTDKNVVLRIRYSSGGTNYLPYSSNQILTGTGSYSLNVLVTIFVDSIRA